MASRSTILAFVDQMLAAGTLLSAQKAKCVANADGNVSKQKTAVGLFLGSEAARSSVFFTQSVFSPVATAKKASQLLRGKPSMGNLRAAMTGCRSLGPRAAIGACIVL
jgi:hypothetical protein